MTAIRKFRFPHSAYLCSGSGFVEFKLLMVDKHFDRSWSCCVLKGSDFTGNLDLSSR